mmetsp:Transcript_29550/g.66524  ORF Transcript_29550/g.66524 Transcript_29550/m.66524 type:complete len:269 (-) Transcript_29550:78-884(-)
MGAVASLLRASKDRRVDACVLDSPYADFRAVVVDYCKETSALQWVPTGMVDFLLAQVSKSVQERVDVDPRHWQPRKVAPLCHCPAFFMAGLADRVVQPSQVADLQKAWGGASVLSNFLGGHNTDRPADVLAAATQFLWESLQRAADADALLCGAVDVFLASDTDLRVPQDRPRTTDFLGAGPTGQEDVLLRSAVECYLDQRHGLDQAIDSYLSHSASPPRSRAGRPPHRLTKSLAVQASPVTSIVVPQARKLEEAAILLEEDSDMFTV